MPTGLYESEPLVSLTGTSIGHYAVDIFFLLSGFLVTQSVVRNPDLLRYALSRILRVFPALIVGTLMTALVLGPVVSHVPIISYYADPETWLYIAGSASTLLVHEPLPGVFNTLPEAGVVNVPLWTLKYELAAYAFLGAIVAVCLTRSRLLIGFVAALMVAAYVAGRAAYPWPEADGIVHNLLHLVPAFFIGSTAYIFRERIPYGWPLFGFLAVSAFVLRETPAYELTEKLLFASVIFWIAFLPSRLSQQFARLGDFSYGIYIFHFPILQTIILYFPGTSSPALFFVGLSITVVVSALSWRWVEKPSLRLRERLREWVLVVGGRLTRARSAATAG